MKIWKPFERWTEKKGNRLEHQWHADILLRETERLYELLPEKFLGETPPKGKIYKVHLSVALEEFNARKSPVGTQ